MYTNWSFRCTIGSIVEGLWVAVSQRDETLEMITLSVESQSCRVGLLAVNKLSRRDGILERLLVRTQGWSFARGVLERLS